MRYHEGSNWQAKKEDEGKPLYESVPKPIQEKILSAASNWNEDIEPHIARGMLKGYLLAKQELDDKDAEIGRLKSICLKLWDEEVAGNKDMKRICSPEVLAEHRADFMKRYSL